MGTNFQILFDNIKADNNFGQPLKLKRNPSFKLSYFQFKIGINKLVVL